MKLKITESQLQMVVNHIKTSNIDKINEGGIVSNKETPLTTADLKDKLVSIKTNLKAGTDMSMKDKTAYSELIGVLTDYFKLDGAGYFGDVKTHIDLLIDAIEKDVDKLLQKSGSDSEDYKEKYLKKNIDNIQTN